MIHNLTHTIVVDSFRTGCNDHLLSENGTISSFGYPNRYREKLDCTTTITVPQGKVVVLNFKSFDVGHQYGCIYEYLSIRDGDAYRKYCYERIPSLYQSKTNKLKIRFKTDPYGSNKGYLATYKTLNGEYFFVWFSWAVWTLGLLYIPSLITKEERGLIRTL